MESFIRTIGQTIRINTRINNPATHGQRRAIFEKNGILKHVSPDIRDSLLRFSQVIHVKSGTTLFKPGESPKYVFFIVSGIVQIRIGLELGLAASEGRQRGSLPSLHLYLLSPGDIVADRDLVHLAAGHASTLTREATAVVMGDPDRPAELVVVEQAELARLLEREPLARLQIADAFLQRVLCMRKLVEELHAFKQRGRTRLARFLLVLFSSLGRPRGNGIELVQPISQGEIATALGLTSRSVKDDIQALEAIEAIDHDRRGRLTLLDRRKLERVAQFELLEEKDEGAQAWLEDVDAALAGGDVLRARLLIHEALLDHKSHDGLRHRAVLAAIRAGVSDEAENLIERYGFCDTHPTEDIAVLNARVLKDRAFFASDADELSNFALQSAKAYFAVYANDKTARSYAGVNAATMFFIAGRITESKKIARDVYFQLLQERENYWNLASRAESLWLLDRKLDAIDCMRKAVRQKDSNDGKLASTSWQFFNLAKYADRDAEAIGVIVRPRPVLVVTSHSSNETSGQNFQTLDRMPSSAYLVVFNVKELAAAAELSTSAKGCRLHIVLGVPIEEMLSESETVKPGFREQVTLLLSEVTCYAIDQGGSRPTSFRRSHAERLAIGLGLLDASLRVTSLLTATSWVPTAGATNICVQHYGCAASPVLVPKPDDLTPDTRALLWVEAIGEGLLDWIDDLDVTVNRTDPVGGALFQLETPSDALRLALMLRKRAVIQGHKIRLCLDIATTLPGSLASGHVWELRPLTTANEIYATEAAAAELILLQDVPVKLRPAGRIRSGRNLGRTTIWGVNN